MNNIFSHAKKPDELSQLFYLPKESKFHNNKQQYSPKLIKLFKSTLSNKKSPINKDSLEIIEYNTNNNNQQISSRKCSFIKPSLLSQSDEMKNEPRQTNNNYTQTTNKETTAIQILSQRQRLVKEILNSNVITKIHESIKPRRKITNSRQGQKQKQRCKTLESNPSHISNNSNNKPQSPPASEQSELIISLKRFKLPAKFRLTFSRNKQTQKQNQQQQQQSINLPLLLDSRGLSLSPIGNKKLNNLSNLQMINKHNQLELQYRSKEFLSVPISITSVTNANANNILNNKKRSQFIQGQAINKINNNNKDTAQFHTNNEKIRLALESFSQQTFSAINDQFSNPQTNNQTFKYQSQRNQNLSIAEKKHSLIFKQQFTVKNHLKTVSVKKKSSQYSKQIKIQQKLPLDEYFKPWEYSQLSKQNSNNFCSTNYFNSYQQLNNIKYNN